MVQLRKLLYYVVFGGIWLASIPVTQAQTWEYFQDSLRLPKYVPCIRPDAGGKLWYQSGTILGSFDGNSWQTHNFSNAGITVQYNTMSSLCHAPDGTIWCGTPNRVLEYKPLTDQWTFHNPSNSAANLNGFDITTDQNGQVYWSAPGAWYQYNGSAWARHYYNLGAEGNNLEPYETRKIIIDPNGEPWAITSGSIGIETGTIIPAGIIHAGAADTVVYNMADWGYPNLLGLTACTNSQGFPMVLVVTQSNGNRIFRLYSYEFGGWQILGDSPTTDMSANDMYLDAIGNLWIGGNIWNSALSDFDQPAVMRRKPNGAWQTYLLDKQQFSYLFTIAGRPDGSTWTGGRKGSRGVLARLPMQPISGATEPAGDCQPISLINRSEALEIQNLPENQSVNGRVMDVQGRLVASLDLTPGTAQIPTANWPKGLYFIQVEASGACPAQTLKFVK